MLDDWENSRMEDTIPSTYDELMRYVVKEYEKQCNNNPEIVKRVKRGGRDAFSLAQQSSKPKCEICEGGHKTADCSWRNKDYSVKSRSRSWKGLPCLRQPVKRALKKLNLLKMK